MDCAADAPRKRRVDAPGQAGGEGETGDRDSRGVESAIRARLPQSGAELRARVVQAAVDTAVGYAVSLALQTGAKRVLAPVIAALAARDKASGSELAVSSVHALAVGANALSLLAGGHFRGSRMWTAWSWRLRAGFAFSAGYAAHDMTVMLGEREGPEMWLHHLVVLLGSFGMLVLRQAAFFPTAFHVTELSVVAHNLSWYFRKLGLDAARPGAYRALQRLRLATFLLFRSFVGPYVIWRYLRSRDAARRAAACHAATRRLATFNVLFLTLLNGVWTAGLARAVGREMARVRAAGPGPGLRRAGM